MRPWSALPASARARCSTASTVKSAADDVSASGLVVDGVLYVRGCNTRYGPLPVLPRDAPRRVLRHEVAGRARSRCSAWPRSTATRSSTRGSPTTCRSPRPTTAGSASRSPTPLAWLPGIGEGSSQRHPNDPLADENKPRMLAWVGKRTAKDKLDAGFAYPKYPWGPGEVVRYNSVHTFVLAAAMDAYLKRRGRSGRTPVGHGGARGLRADRRSSTRRCCTRIETDGSRGIPLLAYGLYPTVDDIAKLTTLLQSGGRHDGQQLLSARKLAEALYRTSPDSGLPLGWHYRAGERTLSPVVLVDPVPHERRLLPADPGHARATAATWSCCCRTASRRSGSPTPASSDVEPMILAGEAIRPLCAPSAAAAVAPPRAPMTAGRAPRRDGRSHVRLRGRDDRRQSVRRRHREREGRCRRGRWRIADDGQYCRAWNVGDRGRLGCYRVYRDGEAFELTP